MNWKLFSKVKPTEPSRCYSCGHQVTDRMYLVCDDQDRTFPVVWRSGFKDNAGYFSYIMQNKKIRRNIILWTEIPNPKDTLWSYFKKE